MRIWKLSCQLWVQLSDSSLRSLLLWGQKTLMPLVSARAESEILLSHVSGTSRGETLKNVLLDGSVSREVARQYRKLVYRRRTGYPLQYLTGKAGFWRHEVSVGPGVLIPRPETEVLVAAAVDRVKSAGVVWDLGTGSGCIALALACEAPQTRFLAVDKSSAALAWAKVNLSHLKNVSLWQADFTDISQLPPLSHELGIPDIIVANPPYLTEDLAAEDLAAELGRYEPYMALSGGKDSIQIIDLLIDMVSDRLKHTGLLFLEHAASQRERVSRLLLDKGFARVENFTDLNEIPRFTRAFR